MHVPLTQVDRPMTNNSPQGRKLPLHLNIITLVVAPLAILIGLAALRSANLGIFACWIICAAGMLGMRKGFKEARQVSVVSLVVTWVIYCVSYWQAVQLAQRLGLQDQIAPRTVAFGIMSLVIIALLLYLHIPPVRSFCTRGFADKSVEP